MMWEAVVNLHDFVTAFYPNKKSGKIVKWSVSGLGVPPINSTVSEKTPASNDNIS